VTVPTIVGDGEGLLLEGEGGTHYVFPGGLEYKAFPMVVPQIVVGGFMGTEVLVRWLPTIEVDEDLGDFGFFGFGVRHKISRYFETLPVDVALGLYIQNLSLGEIISANLFAVNLSVSKTFSVVGVYGGLGYENAGVHAEYTFEYGEEEENVEIDMTGKNHFRFLLGASLNLFVLHLNADFSLGNQSALSVGLGFGL
jgi:hypothetical protein